MKRIISELKQNIETKCYYSALYVALSLIDSCAKLEFQIDEVGKRYKLWLDKFYLPLYEQDMSNPILSSENIYLLRCGILHESTNVIKKDELNKVFLTDGGSHRNKIVINLGNQKVVELQLNTKRFIEEIIESIEKWMETKDEKEYKLDFEIYDKKFSTTNFNGIQAICDCY